MAWLYILFADLFEIAWPFVLKQSAPLSRWAPLFVVIICAVPANYLLASGNGLCSFCRNWDCRNSNRRNGLIWREHEYRPNLLPRSHPPRPHRELLADVVAGVT